MRQAGRYMQEYRDVRKHHSLVEICKKPELAAEVTITAAERLRVDAAIIFADLLLPLEVMGLPFHFSAGEGPVIEKPARSAEDGPSPAANDRVEHTDNAVTVQAENFGSLAGFTALFAGPAQESEARAAARTDAKNPVVK